jgi:hypothetical protein
MVDKNNTLIVRNVTQETHDKLILLATVVKKSQGETLADALGDACKKRRINSL